MAAKAKPARPVVAAPPSVHGTIKSAHGQMDDLLAQAETDFATLKAGDVSQADLVAILERLIEGVVLLAKGTAAIAKTTGVIQGS